MHFIVAPRDGHPLDRLVTALLNVTGVVHRVVGTTEHRSEANGAAVIGLAAERLRGLLALMAEHRSDQELALVTEVLAEATLLTADQLGLGACFVDD
jgi:hypothetical protein